MSTAIERLEHILKERPAYPKEKLEKLDFAAEYFSTKFREFLSPDSNEYRSPVNPVFSFEFELKSLDFFSQLQIVSLRDGVMPLMKFFIHNPEPKESDPLLIVDEALSSLVPELWRQKTVLRSLFDIAPERPRNKVVLFISPHPLSLPLNIFEEEMTVLAAKLRPEDEIKILFSSVRMRGEGEAIGDHAWGYKLLLKLHEILNHRKIEILNFKDYLKEDLTHARFALINPLKFYFTDSFLIHDASQRGALNLLAPSDPKGSLLNLSVNHGFSFHTQFQAYRGQGHDEIARELFANTKSYANTRQFKDIDNKLFSKALSDWGLDVSLEIYSCR